MMQKFLMLPPVARRAAFESGSRRTGVPQQLLEHEWWQSFVLKTIFRLPIGPSINLHGSRCLRPE